MEEWSGGFQFRNVCALPVFLFLCSRQRRRAAQTKTRVRAQPATGLEVQRRQDNAAAGAGNDGGGQEEGASLIL